MKGDLLLALARATADVLETMFFVESSPTVRVDLLHSDSVTCRLTCTGGVNGSFRLLIDRDALQRLGEGFYGDEERSSPTADEDLARELTNMLAGSALSSYLPTQSCALSSPSICSLAEFEKMRARVTAGPDTAVIDVDLDGGTLSLLCVLGRPRDFRCPDSSSDCR